MHLEIPDRKYRVLKGVQTQKSGPVKTICKNGILLEEPEWLALEPGFERATKLRQAASTSERKVASGLIALGFEWSVPMQGYVLDFYHPGRKIDLEIDGPQHRATKDRDRQRDAAMRRLGIRVWRFRSGWAYHDPASMLAKVEDLLLKWRD